MFYVGIRGAYTAGCAQTENKLFTKITLIKTIFKSLWVVF